MTDQSARTQDHYTLVPEKQRALHKAVLEAMFCMVVFAQRAKLINLTDDDVRLENLASRWGSTELEGALRSCSSHEQFEKAAAALINWQRKLQGANYSTDDITIAAKDMDDLKMAFTYMAQLKKEAERHDDGCESSGAGMEESDWPIFTRMFRDCSRDFRRIVDAKARTARA